MMQNLKTSLCTDNVDTNNVSFSVHSVREGSSPLTFKITTDIQNKCRCRGTPAKIDAPEQPLKGVVFSTCITGLIKLIPFLV